MRNMKYKYVRFRIQCVIRRFISPEVKGYMVLSHTLRIFVPIRVGAFALRDKDCAIFYSGDKYYRGWIGEAAGTAQIGHGRADPLPIMG